jgi:hypothetical protein
MARVLPHLGSHFVVGGQSKDQVDRASEFPGSTTPPHWYCWTSLAISPSLSQMAITGLPAAAMP